MTLQEKVKSARLLVVAAIWWLDRSTIIIQFKNLCIDCLEHCNLANIYAVIESESIFIHLTKADYTNDNSTFDNDYF